MPRSRDACAQRNHASCLSDEGPAFLAEAVVMHDSCGGGERAGGRAGTHASACVAFLPRQGGEGGGEELDGGDLLDFDDERDLIGDMTRRGDPPIGSPERFAQLDDMTRYEARE